MTLPASFPLSMSQIAAEIGASLPLSLLDPRVLGLAGKTGAPVSFSDLLGKTGRFDGNASTTSTFGLITLFSNVPWMGGQLYSLNGIYGGPGGASTSLVFTGAPTSYLGNIQVINNTTGVSVVLPNVNSTTWGNSSAPPGNLQRNGITDNFTVIPHL